MQDNMETLAFTSRSAGKRNVLATPVSVSANKELVPNSITKDFIAIWDTGATNTAISHKVVKECGLIPIGRAKINTANGENIVNTYLIDIILPNNLRVNKVTVNEFTSVEGSDLLIGMDIMGLGDMAISNFEGKTVFTFRVPSLKATDYVKEAEKSKIVHVENKPSRNSKCPCGSGKKYKQCCGKDG